MKSASPWGERPGARGRRRTELFAAWTATLVLAFAVCGRLGAITARTAWVMDADEAVHAVEALRLHDDLRAGDPGAFLVHSYFPERWAPPVNDHLRWYPVVHAWLVQPFFALLGPSDLSARLPSVFFLFGTACVFFELARRLADRHGPLSGFLAAAFVLVSPNLLTFSAQSLIAAASVFLTWAALLAWLVSFEAGHPRGRALVAGVLLGTSILTKYDHGGFLALVLGLAELWRCRGSLRAFFASGAGHVFLPAFLMVVAWFAHPDKLAALGDSVRHPFYGSPRTILFDFVATWFVEYAPGLGLGLLSIGAFLAAARRRGRPALRIVWIWALAALLFYASRGRYHFRYNIVEAPAFPLFAALALPGLVEGWLQGRAWPRRAGGQALLWGASALALVLGAVAWAAPGACFEALRGPARWLVSLDPGHLGLEYPADHYVDHFAHEYGRVAGWLGGSLAALGLALFVLSIGRLAHGTRIPGGYVAVALVAGLGFDALRTWTVLGERVEWELEGHPELREVHRFLRSEVALDEELLLAGGWDQLPNNAVRWYLLTLGPERPRFDRQVVVGDMIGSLVFPAEPRVGYEAERLATGTTETLPEVIVFAIAGPAFRYRTKLGNEGAIYRRVLEARPTHARAATRSFPALDLTVEVWRRVDAPPPPLAALPADLPAYERTEAGPGGWLFKDESLRHFIAR